NNSIKTWALGSGFLNTAPGTTTSTSTATTTTATTSTTIHLQPTKQNKTINIINTTIQFK
ncbi:hypothetical protein, partial [Sulfurimonas sp.]|uniref:hypothetical protein n=1 Tax=Sulfurimonas sp. TaxID=2022749 RepID=UPI003D10840D